MKENLRGIKIGMKVLNVLSYVLFALCIIGCFYVLPSSIENTNGLFKELLVGITLLGVDCGIGWCGYALYNYSKRSINTIENVEEIIFSNYNSENYKEFRKENFKNILNTIQF